MGRQQLQHDYSDGELVLQSARWARVAERAAAYGLPPISYRAFYITLFGAPLSTVLLAWWHPRPTEWALPPWVERLLDATVWQVASFACVTAMLHALFRRNSQDGGSVDEAESGGGPWRRKLGRLWASMVMLGVSALIPALWCALLLVVNWQLKRAFADRAALCFFPARLGPEDGVTGWLLGRVPESVAALESSPTPSGYALRQAGLLLLTVRALSGLGDPEAKGRFWRRAAGASRWTWAGLAVALVSSLVVATSRVAVGVQSAYEVALGATVGVYLYWVCDAIGQRTFDLADRHYVTDALAASLVIVPMVFFMSGYSTPWVVVSLLALAALGITYHLFPRGVAVPDRELRNVVGRVERRRKIERSARGRGQDGE